MVIEKISIENYKAFEKSELFFNKDLTVIAAPNGCGKTTLLDAVAILLSWLRARVLNDKGNGISIDEKDIQNGAFVSNLSLKTDIGEWSVAKKRKARNEDTKSDLASLKHISHNFRERLSNKISLPVFAYYSVERAVKDVPLRIKTKHDFNPLSIYEDTLKGNAAFRLFFEWFREREDIENENRRYLNDTVKPEGFDFPDRQLQAVRTALESFLPEYQDYAIRRNPLRMTVKKNGIEYRLDTLSAGETSFIALIGDIARRLAIANPDSNTPLSGDGIVMIDEIDLHLHPTWQRRAISRLKEVFSGIQFIVTTHSPQVLSEVEPQQVRILTLADGKVAQSQPSQTIGLNSVQILDELMFDAGVNANVKKHIDEISDLISKDAFSDARKVIAKLKALCHGSIPAIIEAESTILMLEPGEGTLHDSN
ncbi:MAG: AAA family ATPase [Fibrobacter sp.]|nr:AAA family ATPase [Fibrobacter sp.]